MQLASLRSDVINPVIIIRSGTTLEIKLQIEHEITDTGVCMIRFIGVLDALTTEQAHALIDTLFDNNNYKLVIDLSQVKYITSAGAGLLVGTQTQARQHSGDLVLMNVSSNVQDVLDLLGLTPLFKIVADRPAALHLFS